MQNQFGTQLPLSFWARVEDINDPLMNGRVRIRCFGLHNSDITALPTNKLPWATVLQPTTSAGVHGIGHSGTGLLVGSVVYGQFLDGQDSQVPLIIGTLGANMNSEFNPAPLPASLPAFVTNDTTQSPASTSAYVASTTSSSPGLVQPPSQAQLADVFTLGNLSADEVNKFKNLIGQRESSGNYSSVNQIGYLGKYQFGYSALQTVGFVNTSAGSNSDLNNNNVWTGKLSVHSKSDYLSNQNAQEIAMDGLMSSNYRSLIRNGVISISSPADTVTGYLAVAHLLGTGGCIQLKNGSVGSDANGTTATSYFAIGQAACK